MFSSVSKNVSTAVLVAAFAGSSTAATILSTDFTGTTPNGVTLDDITYVTEGITSPVDSLTVTNVNQSAGNGDLFTTAAASGFLAVANNTGNGGVWTTEIDFSTLSDAIELDNFALSYANFNGTGGAQNALRNSTFSINIFEVPDGVTRESALEDPANAFFADFGLTTVTPIVNTSALGSQTEVFDLSGITLEADTDYIIFLRAADATTGGNNVGFDAISLNGTVVPEPASLALMALGGLLLTRRRRG